MQNKDQLNEPAFVDRRSQNAGIKSGGRRKSDRAVLGGGRKFPIWIAISFAISACILGWAFTAPFRGNNTGVSFDHRKSDQGKTPVNPVSHDSSSPTKDRYVVQMLALEADLQRKLAEKRRVPKNLPDHETAKSRWQAGLRKRVESMKMMAEMADGKIQEGSIEWQAKQDLRDYLEDAPE